jgi:hypothetical protein
MRRIRGTTQKLYFISEIVVQYIAEKLIRIIYIYIYIYVLVRPEYLSSWIFF